MPHENVKGNFISPSATLDFHLPQGQGLSQWGAYKFPPIYGVEKGQSLSKFDCLFDVKSNFFIDMVFTE